MDSSDKAQMCSLFQYSYLENSSSPRNRPCTIPERPGFFSGNLTSNRCCRFLSFSKGLVVLFIRDLLVFKFNSSGAVLLLCLLLNAQHTAFPQVVLQ